MRTTPFHLSEPLYAALAKFAERQLVPTGKTVFRRGQRCPGVFLVLDGRVRLTAGAGKAAIHRVARAGSVLGLPATMRDKPYSLSAVALDDVQLGFIPREVFHVYLREHPADCMEIVQILAEEVGAMRKLQAETAPATAVR